LVCPVSCRKKNGERKKGYALGAGPCSSEAKKERGEVGYSGPTHSYPRRGKKEEGGRKTTKMRSTLAAILKTYSGGREKRGKEERERRASCSTISSEGELEGKEKKREEGRRDLPRF